MAGHDQLIQLVDDAVALGDTEATVDRVKSRLCRLIRSGEFRLPPQFTSPNKDRYARRLLHRDSDRGYSIVVMTWGPGQRTPIHDHAGMWCVEGVVEGSLDVQQYELTEEKGGRFHFEKRNSYEAGVGSAGCLIPPFEYHSIANGSDDAIAVSVHVYGGDMCSCSVFERQADRWFVKNKKALPLDN